MATGPSAVGERLTGTVAVVAAAASPIGRACIERLSGEGADVVDDEGSSVEEVAARCAARWGRIDALVNCHARTERTTVAGAPPGHWERALRDNLLAPISTTVALLPLLRRSSRSSVVHLGSIDGTFGNPHVPGYSVAKAGLVALTHVMADEFAADGIRVNVIARAAVDEGHGEVPDARRTALMSATPLARFADPHDIAAAVAFLVSADAAYVTGTVLVVDGGRTAITPGTR